MPFRPNGAQLAFLDELHSANIILKARQLGFTTLCCLIYLDACLFTPNTRAGVIAHKLDDAKVIFRDKIKYPYDQLDEGLKAACPAVQDSADTPHLRQQQLDPRLDLDALRHPAIPARLGVRKDLRPVSPTRRARSSPAR